MANWISLLMIGMASLYFLGAFLALIFWQHPRLANFIPNIITSVAAVTGIFTSISYLLSGIPSIYFGNFVTSIPYISIEISVDKVGAFFILALSIITLGVSIYSLGYLSHYYGKRNIGLFNFLLNAFILAMLGVLTSANMVTFLIFWELMSIISYFLVIYEAEEQENQKAGTIYLIMTHLATAFLIIAFGTIYKYTGSLAMGSLVTSMPIWLKNILFLCFLIGFGTKAGIIPFHIWLPYAHPAAPSNVSALMSGVMIKIAIYGLIRFVFGMLGTEIQWWGTLILVTGIISTVLGITYALVESNIKKLLAYCSIENIGIILIGLGLSYLSYNAGQPIISALALTAALFHLLNHTLLKGLLFFGAGAIHFSTHTKDMERLGGLLKQMPYTGLFVLIGSLAISAIPPFNGFVSEWLTYQSLFVYLGTATINFKILLILTVAALAMAGALAATSFVKFFGISFLGKPRSETIAKSIEAPQTMLWGMGLLALLSLGLGIFPGLLIKLLNNVILSVTGVSLAPKLAGNIFLVYYPNFTVKNGISPALVLAVGILLFILTLTVVKLLSWKTKERNYGTWDCGFTGLSPRMQYSATGFSKPLRIIFRAIFRPARELEIEEGPSIYFHKSMKYSVTTEPVFEKYLYLPVSGALTKFAKRFQMSIQTGSIHTYLIYIFITIMILLLYFRCYS